MGKAANTKTYTTTTILENEELGGGCRRLLLGGDALAGFKAGQFAMIRIGAAAGDLFLPRPLSILWADEYSIEFVYRVVGRGTERLAGFRPGDRVEIFGPRGGGFQSLPADQVFFVAGGVGMPPLYALARQMIGIGADTSRLHFLYGAASADQLVLTEKIKALGLDPKTSTDDGSAGMHGYISELFDNVKIDPEATNVAYACGPVGMLAALEKICRQKSIELAVSLESRFACGYGVCLGCAAPSTAGGYFRVCKDGPVFDSTKIDWDHLQQIEIVPAPKLTAKKKTGKEATLDADSDFDHDEIEIEIEHDDDHTEPEVKTKSLKADAKHDELDDHHEIEIEIEHDDDHEKTESDLKFAPPADDDSSDGENSNG